MSQALRGSWICVICAALIGASPIANAEPRRIRVEYVPPTNPAHQALYELLQQRRALEKFQRSSAPFGYRLI